MHPVAVLVALAAIPWVAAFNFEFQPATLPSCGRVNVVWRGGQPPFRMLVIPAFDYPQNISIPSSAWDSATQMGNWSWTINYPAQTRLVAMMSDSSAEGSGGVSSLHTVTASDSRCNLRAAQADFLFYLNSTNVNQCAPLEIYWDASARAPVSIIGVIPQGQPFMMSATSGTRLRWNTNVAQGTSFILAAFDSSANGIGGSSDLLTVGGGSAGCLDSSSPSTTPAAPAITSGGSPTSGGGGAGSGSGSGGGGGIRTVTAIATVLPSGSKGLSTGAIAGIAIGAVIAVLTAQALLFWFCCRRQVAALLSHRRDMRKRGVKHGDVDLAASMHDNLAAEHDLARQPSAYSLAHAHSGYGLDTHTHSRDGRTVAGARPSTDGAGTEAESSISPFRNPPSPHQPDDGYTGSGLPTLPSPNSDPFWTRSGSDLLEPPTFLPRHGRTDSLESGTSAPFDYAASGRRMSQQGLLDSPASPAGHEGPGQHSPGLPPGAGPSRPSKAHLVAQFEREERDRQRERALAQAQAQAQYAGRDMYAQPAFYDSHFQAGSGSQTMPRSGSHATSLAYTQAHAQGRVRRGSAEFDGAAGIETRGVGSAGLDDFGAHVPSLAAPRGGFNRHEDAGPLPDRGEDDADADDVEELPPMYRPEWETESQRGASSASMGSLRAQQGQDAGRR